MIRLSCASLSAEGFGETDYVRTFEMFPAAGYKYVEFNLWHAPSMTYRAADDIMKRMKDAGLAASTIHAEGFGVAGGSNLAREVSHKLWMLELSRRFGCTLMPACAYNRGQAGGLETIIAELKHLVPHAADLGIQISLENHRNNNLETLDDYQRIFNEIDAPNLGVTVDTGHFEASGIALDDVIATLGDKINHIHVKENRTFGTQRFTRFGEGTTDNHGFVQKMKARGYQGFVVVELSPQPDRQNTVEDLRKPVEMLKDLIDE